MGTGTSSNQSAVPAVSQVLVPGHLVLSRTDTSQHRGVGRQRDTGVDRGGRPGTGSLADEPIQNGHSALGDHRWFTPIDADDEHVLGPWRSRQAYGKGTEEDEGS